jgi:DNA-binding NarL/FixJ family response regulator
MSVRPRVIIADDHTFVAELCQQFLEPEFDVVDVVTNGRDLVISATDMKPDVILVDIAMPVMNGLEAATRIKAVLPEVKVIYLTMNSDPQIAVHAFDAGASGFILKTCAASDLLLAIRSVVQDRTWISPVLREAIEQLRWELAKSRTRSRRLSPRQREVLQLLAEGKTSRQVAKRLRMTRRTVFFHKYQMMKTLGARNNADLVKYALRNRIVGRE